MIDAPIVPMLPSPPMGMMPQPGQEMLREQALQEVYRKLRDVTDLLNPYAVTTITDSATGNTYDVLAILREQGTPPSLPFGLSRVFKDDAWNTAVRNSYVYDCNAGVEVFPTMDGDLLDADPAPSLTGFGEVLLKLTVLPVAVEIGDVWAMASAALDPAHPPTIEVLPTITASVEASVNSETGDVTSGEYYLSIGKTSNTGGWKLERQDITAPVRVRICVGGLPADGETPSTQEVQVLWN